MRGRLVAGGLALVCALLLPLAAGGRTALTFQLLLERVPGSTTLYLTLTNKGPDPIGLVALRGTDFPITGANVVGGGPAQCVVSGNPATLTCRNFQLQQGKTLTALVATTGTATRALEAVTNGAEPREIDFFPLDVQPAAPRGTVQLTKLPGNRLGVRVTNTGFVTFKSVTVLFKKPKVAKKVVSLRIVHRRSLAGSRGVPCDIFTAPTSRLQRILCRGYLKWDEYEYFVVQLAIRGPLGVLFDQAQAQGVNGMPAILEDLGR